MRAEMTRTHTHVFGDEFLHVETPKRACVVCGFAIPSRLVPLTKRERQLVTALRECIGAIDDEIAANPESDHPIIRGHARTAEKARALLARIKG